MNRGHMKYDHNYCIPFFSLDRTFNKILDVFNCIAHSLISDIRIYASLIRILKKHHECILFIRNRVLIYFTTGLGSNMYHGIITDSGSFKLVLMLKMYIFCILYTNYASRIFIIEHIKRVSSCMHYMRSF